jgi:hypothetical protein
MAARLHYSGYDCMIRPYEEPRMSGRRFWDHRIDAVRAGDEDASGWCLN